MYPDADPWGRPFSKDYYPDRFRMAGRPLAQGFIGAFDGVMSDWEFVKKLFNLQRFLDTTFSIESNLS